MRLKLIVIPTILAYWLRTSSCTDRRTKTKSGGFPDGCSPGPRPRRRSPRRGSGGWPHSPAAGRRVRYLDRRKRCLGCVRSVDRLALPRGAVWSLPAALRGRADDESERAESIKVGTGGINEPESTRPRLGAAGGDDNRLQPPDPHRPD